MSQEIDTSAGAYLWVSRYKRRNVLIGAFVQMFVSMAFWVFLVEALTKNAALEAAGWGLFALALDTLAVVEIWVGIFRWGPPATGLRIESDGIVVHYPKKSRTLKWRDRGIKITIRTLNHFQEEDSQYQSTQWSVIESRWTFWPRLVLRPDQEAVLLEAASRAGMDVRRVRDSASDSGEAVVIASSKVSRMQAAGVHH